MRKIFAVFAHSHYLCSAISEKGQASSPGTNNKVEPVHASGPEKSEKGFK